VPFAVETCDVAGYALLLHRASGDFRTALRFLDRHMRVDGAARAPLWEVAHEDHRRQVATATQLLQGFGSVLEAAHRDLKKTGRWYESAAPDEAQGAETAFPVCAASPPTRQQPVRSATFQDLSDAVDHLTPTDPGGTTICLTDDPAPTFDADILGTPESWRSYTRCAASWRSLGNFCTTVARNLRQGNNMLALTWRGNAAHAAWMYFERLAATLDAVGGTFRALRGCYADIAEKVRAFACAARCAFARIRLLTARAATAGTAAAASHVAGLIAECDALVTRHEKAVESVTSSIRAGGALLPQMAGELVQFTASAMPSPSAVALRGGAHAGGQS
jgi:hypothetical protein